MVGLEEDLFPHFNSLEDPTDVEEERRLCYVGMTRAKRHLMLSCAYHRTIFGQRKMREPSRFLAEIPEEYVDLEVSTQRDLLSEAEATKHEPEPEDGGNHTYRPGMRVSHSHFGTGAIESVMGSGDDARLTIQFDSLPHPKVLVAKYAKLRTLK
jgi:DNA helicase-2/ATP-dependent DNA helicase PcrA